MEHGLSPVKLGNRGKHAAGVTSEQNNIGRMARGQAGNLCVVDVLDWIGTFDVLDGSV